LVLAQLSLSQAHVCPNRYEATEDNELSFDEGEVIRDIEAASEDWWQGVNAKGETGLFPAAYVQVHE